MGSDKVDPVLGSNGPATDATPPGPDPETEQGFREGAAPSCVECASSLVRPSRSAYRLDEAKRRGGDGSFWRCENCGHRFLGPPAPEQKKHHRRRSSSRRNDELNRSVKMAREVKRYLFPVLVILATIIAVMYILDRRSDRAQQYITFPE